MSTKNFGLFFVCIFAAFVVVMGIVFTISRTTPTAVSQPEKHVQVAESIIINQPGYTSDWPAYAPNKIVLPANSMVTITITDNDASASALPKDSPYATASGIIGSVKANGISYTSLKNTQVAHTFTIQQLGINVPLLATVKSGDVNKVTFTIRTGAPGMYMYSCLSPCGSGDSGYEGPMVTMRYMQGMITVQ